MDGDADKANLGYDEENQSPILTKVIYISDDKDIAAPDVDDNKNDKYAFVGWFEESTGTPFDKNNPVKNAVYVATFGPDDDQDNVPDEYEVSVKFVIENGYYTDPDTQEKKTELKRSYGLRDANGNYSLSGTATVKEEDAPAVIADDGYKADGVAWNPTLPLLLDQDDKGKETKITFTCVLADDEKDENGDGKPDSQQILVKFDLAGQAGAIFDPAIVESATVKVVDGNVYYDVTEAAIYPEAPGVKVVLPEDDEDDPSQKKVFDAWVGEDGSSAYPEGGSIDQNLKGSIIAYLATYLDDIDGDEVADKYQKPAATIAPYETTIYVGGSNVHEEDGFPNLDLNLSGTTSSGETVDRPVDVTNIKKIYINGVAQETTDIDSLFRAVYVYEDSTGVYILENDAAVQDDMDQDATQQAGEYTIAVALTDQVKLEDDGITTYNAGISLLADDTDAATTTGDGFTILNGRPMLARQADAVMIEAENRTAKVEFADDKLKVRPVSDVQSAANNDIHRPVLNSEAEVAASLEIDKDKAFAVVESDNYTVNNNADRPVMDTSEVHLLVDNILPQTATDTADRLGSLKEKANQELGLGMSAEEADAAGYNYEIMYLDLVDGNNGNAWVAAEGGSDIYWPYPDQVKDNYNDYEFKFVHYKDLHREYNLENQSAIDAIAGADVEIIIPEKTEYGLKFHTDKAGFSPFALVWNDAGNFDGTTDEPGTDTPSTGGGTSSTPTGSGDATPSGPVSVQQSGNSKGYYYTAGLHGNWVHMDNVDMNIPIDEPVPAGATAVDFPEWHRWRFYLSSGVMLDNQWAHIENPYAVGDQPRSGWFYFDHDGLMRYGWYLDTRSGDWYYMHSESDGMLGTMMTGWHYDSHDNRWYYLDPQSGAMKTGWQNIGGKWYYFNPTPFGETWTLDHSTSVWRFNGNTVRPYGSMYQNEVTPDGYKVGEDGAWIQ
ncbi:MAG TPA: hypothetical protein IAB09_04715 [Candidatus Avilachnospira avicola]|nr:hypothetical protein [Candidatus Avilachnospira avicola]